MEIIIRKNKITYEDQGKGLPIVFLPGINGKNSIWEKQIDTLSMSHRVITVDLSEINNSSINIHELIKILDEFFKELKLEYFFLCGYSVGGLLALCYGNRHPENICGISTTSVGNISASTNEVVKFYMKNFRPAKSFWKLLIDKILGKRDPLFGVAFRFASLIKYHTILQEYSKLPHPLLLINGEFDHLSSHSICQTIYSNRESNIIQLEILEQSRKDCFNTNPNEYNEILKDFIKTTTTPK